MADRYRIVDEPAPSPIAHLAVRPLWPLLGLMLGGAWLAWPWFLLNARALGAGRRAYGLAWIAAAVLGAAGFIAAVHRAVDHGWVPRGVVPWLVLVLTVWKLAVAYVLHENQSATAELFAHFGGRLRNGGFFLVAAFFLGRRIHPWIEGLPGLLGDVAFAVLW